MWDLIYSILPHTYHVCPFSEGRVKQGETGTKINVLLKLPLQTRGCSLLSKFQATAVHLLLLPQLSQECLRVVAQRIDKRKGERKMGEFPHIHKYSLTVISFLKSARGLLLDSPLSVLIAISKCKAALSSSCKIQHIHPRQTHHQLGGTLSSDLLPQSDCYGLLFRLFKLLFHTSCPESITALSERYQACLFHLTQNQNQG